MSRRQVQAGNPGGHLGRSPGKYLGAVNTPVFRASTMLFPTVAKLEQAARGEYEGSATDCTACRPSPICRTRSPPSKGRMPRLRCLRGSRRPRCRCWRSCSAGDHVLVTDAVYGPTRRFCNNHLLRLGVEVSYYDPLLGAAIEREFRPNTRVVFTESPGSLTFCVQDIPAIAAVAHRRGALVVTDNSWATPFGFRSFDHGVDVSVHAATKYIGGHSDVLSRPDPRDRGDVPGAAPAMDGHRRDRVARRLLPRAARLSHAAAAPCAPRRERAQDRAVAARRDLKCAR